MNYHAATGLKIRIFVVLAFFGIGAGGILARAVQIQVVSAPRLKELANRQQRHTIEVRARRGDILDSRGEALAVSREEAQVYVHPQEVANRAEVARKLAGALGLPEREISGKLSSKESFVWLTRAATNRQAELVRTLKLKGVGILPASRRFYPGGAIAANILGFTGLDGKGLEGLEFFYEDRLAGRPMQMWLEQDARGNAFLITDNDQVVEPDRELDPRFDAESRGTSLKLTILRPLQYLAERELEQGVKASGARAGCVVAMEPDTGRILAMASYPTYDPNRFGRFSQDSFRNRCLVGAFEPGSTFKVFVIAAALEEGKVRSDERFFCENGSFMVGGSTIRDTKPHGTLSVEEIIAVSSNIGAAKIGDRMGWERITHAARAFGFGSRTGVDFPGESAGVLPSGKHWSDLATATFSFGQGLSVTPLQLVAAVSAIANGGRLMKPYLVESVVDPDGNERRVAGPSRVRQVISPQTATTITRFMQAVVSEHGTGIKAAVSGYAVAGKTGTAQKSKENARGYAEGKYFSSFLGFLPADRPRLAMIVVLDEPHTDYSYGGLVAAPIFAAIAKQAMVLLKVPGGEEPEIAEAAPPPSGEVTVETDAQSRIRQWQASRAWTANRQASNQDGVLPDLRGFTLRQALRVADAMQLQVEVSGSGTIVSQTPEAGSPVRGGQTLRIKLEDTL